MKYGYDIAMNYIKTLVLPSLLMTSVGVCAQTTNQTYGVGDGVRNFSFEDVFGGQNNNVHFKNTIGTDFSAKKIDPAKQDSNVKSGVSAFNIADIFTLPADEANKEKEPQINFSDIFSVPSVNSNNTQKLTPTVTPKQNTNRTIEMIPRIEANARNIIPEITTHFIPVDSPATDLQSTLKPVEKIDDSTTSILLAPIPAPSNTWSMTVNPEDVEKRRVLDYVNGVLVRSTKLFVDGNTDSITEFEGDNPIRMTFFNEDGSKNRSYLYRQGSIYKGVSFFKTGEVDSVYSIESGNKVRSDSYYKSGELHQTYLYENDNSNKAVTYYKSGEKKEDIDLSYGLYDKVVQFSKTGIVTNVVTYHRGEVVENIFYLNAKTIDKVESSAEGRLIKRVFYKFNLPLKSHLFVDGLHRQTELFYKNGVVGKVDELTEDMVIKTTIYHDDGILKLVKDFSKGVNTTHTGYFKSGEIETIENFTNDVIDKSRTYNIGGKVVKLDNYINGVLLKISLYDYDGLLLQVKDFKDDVHEKTSFYYADGRVERVVNLLNGVPSKIYYYDDKGGVIAIKKYHLSSGN